MKKIGTAYGNILVTLSAAEFSGLSGKHPSNVMDGTEVSLARINKMSDLVEDKAGQLVSIREEAAKLIAALDGLKSTDTTVGGKDV